MRLLTTVVGGAICGALVFGVWPEMWKSYGIMGGWLAATIVIGICWYMNHWIGMIWNEPGRIWVDQGWAVSSSGIVWAVVRFRAVGVVVGSVGDAGSFHPRPRQLAVTVSPAPDTTCSTGQAA